MKYALNIRGTIVKIMIINPNSDLEMTKIIQDNAEKYAKGEFDVICKPTPGASKFVGSYEDMAKSVSGMIKLIRENEKEFDGFVVACGADPNLDLIKEITVKPVVGIAESSMKIASMLGHRFAIIQASKRSVPYKETLIHKYHMTGLGFAKVSKKGIDNYRNEEAIYNTARLAIEEDGAEVIILSCAGMAGLDKILRKRLGIPVLDGVICGLIILTGLIKCGISTSKIGRYQPTE